MPSKSPAILASLLVLAFFTGTRSAEAQPELFRTALILETPVQNSLGIDSIVYHWSTFDNVGTIGEDSLIDLSMEVKAGDVLVYVDEILVDGVVQPIGGQSRQLDSDLFWDFDFDGANLLQMRNASYATMEMGSGEHFHVTDSFDFLTDGVLDVGRYQDGVWVDGGGSEQLLRQRTELVLFSDGFESGDLLAWSSSTP